MAKVLSLVISFMFLNFSFAVGQDWEKIDEEKGVKIYQKEIPGSSVLAFRGVAIVEASLAKIYYVLQDYKHEKEWVDMLDKNVILKNFSKDERIQYQSFDLPWPISDRDFVYHATSTLNKSGEKILLNIKEKLTICSFSYGDFFSSVFFACVYSFSLFFSFSHRA